MTARTTWSVIDAKHQRPNSPYRVAIVFPADPERRQKTRLEDSRFARTAAALAEKGIAVEGAPYVADDVEGLREQLMRVDGVLVWINPIVDGRDRTDLNKVLADVAASGVFVSAHPDVIAKMGTKDILFRTRTMGWGCDTRHYPTFAAMRRELPESLATGEARVLKQARGHSGDGVWKVELADQDGTRTASVVSPHAGVRVRHAKRGSVETTMSLAAFIAQCEPYFSRGDGMIDQIYQRRLPEGMVRCYLVRDHVAGFGEQLVNALYPAEPGAACKLSATARPTPLLPAHTGGLPAAQGQAGARVVGPALRHRRRRQGAIADPVGCRFSLRREGRRWRRYLRPLRDQRQLRLPISRRRARSPCR